MTEHMPEVDALRALAHPMRMRILGSLRIDGPATSALLARRLGTDSGQTSHHLRLLNKHGFVEDAPELGRGARGRERWWKASQETTSWPDDPDELGPGSADVIRALNRAARRVWDDVVETYRDQAARGEWSAEWQAAGGFGDTAIRTTPSRLAELRTAMRELIDSYEVEPAPDTETVVVMVQAYPYRPVQ
ncbi:MULTISPECIES: helix-turn-helix domain-containing protein [Actinoplanes]|uniref:helix-turn-helix domain-containing protein n=1 Tax=Actinoplanes TaxID=1865 RepID=UPI0005F2FA14|nr:MULTISPECIES: helix-turn-helix domain-containing protein [Actinoplanes]GLY02649.1 transcriptional regulator [Actinoplanes sp. NBRC 101535]